MREFLSTGQLGQIRLGDPIEVVRQALGAPHDTGGTSRRYRTPTIWKYGDIEFHLTEQRTHLRLIFCDGFERLTLGSVASIDPWFLDEHPTIEAVERELAAAAIEFRKLPAPEPTEILLRLKSGVELIFGSPADQNERLGLPRLIGFQHTTRNAK